MKFPTGSLIRCNNQFAQCTGAWHRQFSLARHRILAFEFKTRICGKMVLYILMKVIGELPGIRSAAALLITSAACPLAHSRGIQLS